MINRILNTGIVTLAAAICLLPTTGSASTVFTMSGPTGSTISGSGGTETVIIDWSELSVGSTNYGSTYVETYTNSGLLTLKEGGSTILSITEAPNLAGTFSGSAISLYSAPTALTISAPLLGELGLSTSPPVADLTAGSYSVTAPAGGTGATFNNNATSETSAFTLTVTTPEPSTFAMFGLALLSVIGYTARKRSVRS